MIIAGGGPRLLFMYIQKLLYFDLWLLCDRRKKRSLMLINDTTTLDLGVVLLQLVVVHAVWANSARSLFRLLWNASGVPKSGVPRQQRCFFTIPRVFLLLVKASSVAKLHWCCWCETHLIFMCDTNTFEEAVKVNLAWNRRVTLSVLESPRCSKVGEKGYINGAAENFRVLFKIPCFFSLLWFKTLFLKVWGFSFKHRAGGTTSKPPEGNALMHIEYSKSRDFCSSPSFFFPTNAIL